MTRRAEAPDAGFTLIELLISLLLFALIAVAGIALVDSVLGVEGRTGARLDRLTDLQRAMLVVSGDVEQVSAGDITGGGASLTFRRSAPGVGGPPVTVRYGLDRGVLVRDAGSGTQAVLRDVAGVRWRFYEGGWSDRWPLGEAKAWPRAVEVEVTLTGTPSGAVRRVMLLPVRARDVS
ncbi:prepilin-type N-terminal cleavage/methylation domain-containing protein [Sphingomonas donggukensis]|uniref:Type II secretion system protein J n=1 Tax=Sphingomonas donggukensis TaxID=2949093 RepID=A0ABY4TT35_9SPHN|nr:type II secretion system protein GspJ [Sphingomonas donggukensis]URW74577.1 prepilin-type N-terminal cleavage/methylation domain-containing protein [Sphingomonas donggukensis]